MSPDAAYAELVALAERERDLAVAGRWEELAAASAERVSRAAALGTPGPGARPHLERLAALQRELLAKVAAARALTARELAELGRGRGAVRGYGAAMPVASGQLDYRG
jgi:hypothetical protein